MLKSDATPARKTPSAPDGNAVPKDNKRTQVAAGFLRQIEPAEPAIVEGAVSDQTPSQDAPSAPEPSQSSVAAHAGEIELKLLVDADRMAHFNAAPVIAANARNKGVRKHFKSVYYDTPERMLRRNGLSLRVRQSGARFVQTVKTDAADDPLRRGEWEASVTSLAPDLALAVPFIPEKLRSRLEARPLEAVFTADVHRHARMIDLPSGTVEIAFDRGVLTASDRSLPVSEIELELKSGSASAIYEVALRLAEHGAVKPSIRSKSARGFDLAAGAPPAARRPRKLRLDPSVTLDEAFATILRSCFLHLLQSLPAAEDGRNPEGVHQLRVALRRIRSALDLMRSVGALSNLGALRSEARWLAQDLSAARDWDVFQLETLPTIAKACPSIAGFDALGRAAAERQSDAYRKAHHALDDRRCAMFLIGLGGWIDTGLAQRRRRRRSRPARRARRQFRAAHSLGAVRQGAQARPPLQVALDGRAAPGAARDQAAALSQRVPAAAVCRSQVREEIRPQARRFAGGARRLQRHGGHGFAARRARSRARRRHCGRRDRRLAGACIDRRQAGLARHLARFHRRARALVVTGLTEEPLKKVAPSHWGMAGRARTGLGRGGVGM